MAGGIKELLASWPRWPGSAQAGKEFAGARSGGCSVEAAACGVGCIAGFQAAAGAG